MIKIGVGQSVEVQWTSTRQAHSMRTPEEMEREGWRRAGVDSRYGSILMMRPIPAGEALT